MKIKVISVIMCFVCTATFAQTDSLYNGAENSKSKLDTIAKERNLLLENFIAANEGKVKEIKDYLKQEMEDENYRVLFDAEYWLILFWTREYEELLQSIKKHESKAGSYNPKINPPEDWLYDELFTKSKNSKIVLRSFIKNSELEDEEKDFLLMQLKYLTTGAEEWDQAQEELNRKADEFLENYNESEYQTYTKEYIRYRTVPSPWGFGFNFFSGYGILNDRLGENFSNNVPFGFAVDVEYQKFIFSLNTYIGFAKTEKDISYNGGVWAEDSNATIFIPQFSFGYILLDNKRFKIAPFGGIGGTSINPITYDIESQPGLEEAGLDFTVTYTYGINLDIKLGLHDQSILAENETGYWFIRLRYEYVAPQFKGYFRGNMHAITIGIGGFGRDSKRIK